MRTWALLGGAAIAAVFAVSTATAVDVYPYGYAQFPSGVTALELYPQYLTSHSYSSATAGGIGGSKATEELTLFELVRTFDIADIGVSPLTIVPYGSINHVAIDGQRLKSQTGVGDPLVAAIIAPIHDQESTIGGAVGGWLPIGHYTAGAPINIGQDRWRGAVQLGGMQHVSGPLTIEFYTDATFYGANDRAGTGSQRLTQERSFQSQPWLRWNFTPFQSVSLGYSAITGGRQKLDGAATGVELYTQQARLEYEHILSRTVGFSLQAARDLAGQGGFKSDATITGRFVYGF